MFANLQISRTLAKNEWMDRSAKTVSESALHQEWEEIRAAQGNPALFRPLYERYYESVFRLIHRRTSDMELSGDLCSQVFLKRSKRLTPPPFRVSRFRPGFFALPSTRSASIFGNNKTIGWSASTICICMI